MSDLSQRLRAGIPCGCVLGHGESCAIGYLCDACSLREEAAAEIERFRQQIADLTSIAGVAAVGKSFAEIAKDLPRRSGESD